MRILPYRTIDNVIDGVVITFTDTTAAKMLETTLREQADQLKQVSSLLPNLVFGCRPDGACDFLGQRWVDYTGVPEAEQLGYGWLEQVHPDMRDHVREEWKSAIATRKQLETDLRVRGARGTYHWFKALLVPIHDAHGAILKWYCTCTDIDELRRTAEQCKDAEQRLAKIVDTLDEAVIGLDEELRVTIFNGSAERLFGTKQNDVLGNPFGAVSNGRIAGELAEIKRSRESRSFHAAIGAAAEDCVIRVVAHDRGFSVICRKETPSTRALETSKLDQP